MGYTENLIRRCGFVIDGSEDETVEDLMAEAYGYIEPMRKDGVDGILDDRSIDGLRKLKGWLGRYADELRFSGGRPSVSAVSVSEAKAVSEVDVSQVVECVEQSGLSEEAALELKAAVLDLAASKGKGANTVAKKLRDALDIAKASAAAAKAVMDFAVPIIQHVSS